MADYIAFLDSNNRVEQVVQCPDDNQDWVSIYAERSGSTCLTTAKDGSIRHQFARKGFTYYSDLDAFIEPKPYPSWTLNTTEKRWEAPVAMPTDGIYEWDEATTSWVFVVQDLPLDD